MPSRNPVTGKRYSGASQRKRKKPLGSKESQGYVQRIERPPVEEGVESCISWANDVGLLCIATARDGSVGDLVRVRVVSQTLAKLGRLKEKALRSEQAVQLRGHVDAKWCRLSGEDPPIGDAMAAVGWAYFQLVGLLYEQCQEGLSEETLQRWEVRSNAIARLGYVQEQAETVQLTRRYLAQQKKYSGVELTHASALGPSCSSRVS